MSSKCIAAAKLAFPRFLLGAMGTWAVIGPIVLLVGSAHGIIALVLWLLLLPCYFFVLTKSLGRDREALKELVSETSLALSFVIIGLLLHQMVGVYLGLKPDLVIVYIFIGFFIAELTTQPKAPFEPMFRKISALLHSFGS